MNQLRVIENGLVPIYQSEEQGRVVNGRELHEFLEVGDRFDQWIQRRIEKYGFIEDADFCTILCETQNGRPRTDYLLKMDTAKEIAMVENNEKGRVVRKYFIEVEKKHKALAIDASQLSPELQMFNTIFQAVAKVEVQSRLLEEQQNEIKATLTAVKDTLLLQKDDNWRQWVKETMNKVAKATGGDHQKVRSSSYELLEDRAKCNLGIRLTNLKDRLRESGATKTKVENANKLDVIENDARLKEIYSTILKEFAIKYIA